MGWRSGLTTICQCDSVPLLSWTLLVTFECPFLLPKVKCRETFFFLSVGLLPAGFALSKSCQVAFYDVFVWTVVQVRVGGCCRWPDLPSFSGEEQLHWQWIRLVNPELPKGIYCGFVLLITEIHCYLYFRADECPYSELYCNFIAYCRLLRESFQSIVTLIRCAEHMLPLFV